MQKSSNFHFLSMKTLTDETLHTLMDRTAFFLQQQFRLEPFPFQHHTLACLFFENSTRTRCSFELAAKRLGMHVIDFNETQSSVQKGETLQDTFRTLQAMHIDNFVIRHREEGVPAALADIADANTSIINAGDGTNEHPSQALLDIFTIRQIKKDFAKLSIAIVGDIRHSRVAHSDILALHTLGVQDIRLVGPTHLLTDKFNVLGVSQTTDLVAGIANVDVVMLLRVQKERIQSDALPNEHIYFETYGLTEEKLKDAKPDAIVMHPAPINRGIEIDSAVADGPRAVIWQQVTHGVAARMAILEYLIQQRQRRI